MDLQNAQSVAEVDEILKELGKRGPLNPLIVVNSQLKKVQLLLKERKRNREEEPLHDEGTGAKRMKKSQGV